MKSLGKYLKPVRFTLIIIALIVVYAVSLKITQFDPLKLVVSAPKAGKILGEFFAADIFTRSSGTTTYEYDFPVPCGAAAEAVQQTSGPRIEMDIACGDPGQAFDVHGVELEANTVVDLLWVFPDGNSLNAGRFTTDSNGEFSKEIEIRPILKTTDGVPVKLRADVSTKSTHLVFTDTVNDVVDAMVVTIFMALLATTIGTIFAIPLGFMAASNITRHGPIGTGVYYIVRALLNLIRSYEPLVLATIFALIVGYGTPLAGILALVFVTTASLGKMFSESVEGIDSGPIEALRATGANWGQVIFYAVIPQIIPDFLSFAIYHWDINVRISTIIGFVGGGGIGYYLSQRINSLEYAKAGTALYAIIIVVWILDFLSARIRKELV
ncbi:MAG: phosphonate ABC transporter, permease protein PhnE [Chloroflexi bacterium]|nr:phosphonate ABC transporter, permease protein PhnE [Chloroflexota bacterium]